MQGHYQPLSNSVYQCSTALGLSAAGTAAAALPAEGIDSLQRRPAAASWLLAAGGGPTVQLGTL